MANPPPDIKKRSRVRGASAAKPQGKLAMLRQALIKESMIAGAILAVLFGGYTLASGWESDETRKKDSVQDAFNKLTQDTSHFQASLVAAEKALPLYQKLFKESTPEIALDRRTATEVLEQLKDQYLFAAMRFNMSPLKDLEDAKLKNKFVVGQYVEMDISIDALSDEHILNFLNDLRQQLPGKIKIVSLSIVRQSIPNSQILALITQSGKVGLVKADVKLQWIGMHSLTPLPASAANPAKGG